MDNSKWYDKTGAAKFLGITHQAVSQDIDKGYIKGKFFPNIGRAGKVLYHESDLLTFIWSDNYMGRTGWQHRQNKEGGSEGE